MISNIQTDLFAPATIQEFEKWADSKGGRHVLQIAYAITARYARRFQFTGRRVSMKLIWEQLRDNIPFIRERMKSKGIMLDRLNGFALNNNFHAHVARHILQHKPKWAGLFELREVGKVRTKRKVIVVETKMGVPELRTQKTEKVAA